MCWSQGALLRQDRKEPQVHGPIPEKERSQRRPRELYLKALDGTSAKGLHLLPTGLGGRGRDHKEETRLRQEQPYIQSPRNGARHTFRSFPVPRNRSTALSLAQKTQRGIGYGLPSGRVHGLCDVHPLSGSSMCVRDPHKRPEDQGLGVSSQGRLPAGGGIPRVL